MIEKCWKQSNSKKRTFSAKNVPFSYSLKFDIVRRTLRSFIYFTEISVCFFFAFFSLLNRCILNHVATMTYVIRKKEQQQYAIWIKHTLCAPTHRQENRKKNTMCVIQCLCKQLYFRYTHTDTTNTYRLAVIICKQKCASSESATKKRIIWKSTRKKILWCDFPHYWISIAHNIALKKLRMFDWWNFVIVYIDSIDEQRTRCQKSHRQIWKNFIYCFWLLFPLPLNEFERKRVIAML